MTPRAFVVVAGEEVLEGRAPDGNGPWLAARLQDAGSRVVGMRVVADEAEAVASAIRAAAAEAEVVVVTGGLGPTPDDRTREGLALAAGTELVEDPGALEALEASLGSRGLPLDELRRRQARVPRGGRALANPAGTAPGVVLRLGEATVWALPGVVHECRAMFERFVLPDLAAGGHGASAGLFCAGIHEPDVARRLEGVAEATDTRLALYPHEGELEIRFRAQGEGAATRVEAAAAESERRLGNATWRGGRIEEAVVAALAARNLLLATAESMTGGLVAAMVTGVPGASDVYAGGWVTYSDRWKEQALGVDQALLDSVGAVSPEVARAMAEGARDRAPADAGLSITGVAGPQDGQSPGGAVIPQGTFHVGLALAGAATRVVTHHIALPRPAVRRRAAVIALDLLRRAL